MALLSCVTFPWPISDSIIVSVYIQFWISSEESYFKHMTRAFFRCHSSLLSQHENTAGMWGEASATLYPSIKQGKRSGLNAPAAHYWHWQLLIGAFDKWMKRSWQSWCLLLPVMTLLIHSSIGFFFFLFHCPSFHSCFLGSPPVVGGMMVPICPCSNPQNQ